MRLTCSVPALVLICGLAFAADKPAQQNIRDTSVSASDGRAIPPHNATTSLGPAQAGYVHYFLITHPDDSLEHQVGIELEDRRIAWSFPEGGVMVSDFIAKGTLSISGKTFKIEHLYGVRPFAHDNELRALQKNLNQRVARWVDDQIPYCVIRQPGQTFCLNCGDFVLRILYPGAQPLRTELPHDFIRAASAGASADNLLLYLLGLHNTRDKRATLAKLATLDVPVVMREDIIAMIDSNISDAPTTPVAAAPQPATPARALGLPATLKPQNAGRIATRRVQAKKL